MRFDFKKFSASNPYSEGGQGGVPGTVHEF
mgnify:CR=1 FL=1